MIRSTRFGLSALAAVLSLSIPAAPRAEIAPEAKPIVERFLAVSGGREAWARVRGQRMVGSLTAFGIQGTVRTWAEKPDRRASEVNLGPFNLRDGSDGAKAWRTDPSGKPLPLDGKDLEDAIATAWFENERWLEPGEGGGKVAYAGAGKDSLGSYDVLEVSPPAGRSRRFFFDKRTGLLSKTESKNDRQTIHSRQSDWREVEGRKVAFHFVQEVEGMPMNTITINTDTLEFNPEASATRFEIPLEANAPVFLRNPGYATIPANYRANHLWLKVSVNGQPPADFIYDTGASVTVIDSAYAQKLGIQRQGEFQGQGAGAAGSASLGELSVLRVLGDGGDGIEMKNLKVGILGVNHGLAEFFWRDCAGILGFDVLNRFVNEIDYDRGVLTLRDPKTYQYEGKGATLPFTLSGHVPVVKFKLDGQYEGEARLDVGSGGSLDLHGPFWKKHDLKAKAGKTLEVTGGGFGGTFKNYLARAKRLEVGPYGWDAPTISFFGAETGALASEDFAGNFGNRVFDRFKLTIDYERRQIHLEPGARYADPFRFSRFGGQLMMQDGKVKVGEALPGSPAARAGLVAGDVILSINGQDPRELDLPGVTQLFENTPAGAKVEIEFTHGTKKIKKSVKLEDLI